MENPLTNRVLSRLFPSPFGSCRIGTLSDVVEDSITISTRNPPEVLRPFQSPLSSTSTIETHSFTTKPRTRSSTTSKNGARNEGKKVFSEHKSSNFNADKERRRCPVKPLSPLMNSNGEKERAKQFQSAIVKHSSSSNGGWFSSEEGQEGEVDGGNGKLFSLSSGDSSDSSPLGRKTSNTRRGSSKSMSCGLGRSPFEPSATSTNGNSSRCESGKFNAKARRKTGKTRRKSRPESFKVIEESASSTGYFYAYSERLRRLTAEGRRRSSGGRRSFERRGEPPVVGGRTSRVEESYAVVKASNDPHRDFRESMVEMIVEKGIYGAEDLQKLVRLFLSLNSSHHRPIILEVFSEICEALLNH